MATVHSLFTGEISGKLGDKVYYQVNGKTVVRSLPAKKKWDFTPKQKKHMERFSAIIHYCQKFKHTVIPLVWNKLKNTASGWSAFMKANAAAFNENGVLSDVRQLRLSSGKLSLPEELTVRRKPEDETMIEVSWKRDLNMGGVLLWDELLAVCSAHDEYSSIISTGIIRGDLGGSFPLSGLKTPATHLFLFFASDDRENFTESVCFEI